MESNAQNQIHKLNLRSTEQMNSPIAPRVFSSLRDPKAMEGRRQAKYRKIMVVMYFPIALLFPIIPGTNHNTDHVGKALKASSHQPQAPSALFMLRKSRNSVPTLNM